MKRGDGTIAIDLVDGERLCDLLKDNRLGVETVEGVRIHEDWFKIDWGVTVYVQNALQEVGLIEYLPANTNTGQAVGALTEARQFGVQLRWRPQQL